MVGPVSQKFLELIYTHPDLAKNGPQGARVDLGVIRNHRLCEGLVPTHDNVAAVLATDSKSNSCQRGHDFPPGNPRDFAHTATIMGVN